MGGVERCPCCDLPVESCGRAVAQQRDREARAQRERALNTYGTIPARFPGKCPGCGEWIDVGDPIRRTTDGWVGVLCCGEAE